MTSKYPFDDWLDGRVWLLRSQADFLCLAMSMQGLLYNQARAREMSVATKLIGWNGETATAILVQAFPLDSTWKPNLSNVPWNRIKKAMENKR